MRKSCQITFEKVYEFVFDKQMAEWQYNLVIYPVYYDSWATRKFCPQARPVVVAGKWFMHCNKCYCSICLLVQWLKSQKKSLSQIRTGMHYLSALYSTVKVIQLTEVLAECFIDSCTGWILALVRRSDGAVVLCYRIKVACRWVVSLGGSLQMNIWTAYWFHVCKWDQPK